MSLKYRSPVQLCTGSLPSPPDSPLMSRRFSELGEAGQCYSGLSQLPGYSSVHQGQETAAGPERSSPRQSRRENTALSQSQLNHALPRVRPLEDSSSRDDSLSSAAELRQSAERCPQSLTATLSSYNRTPKDCNSSWGDEAWSQTLSAHESVKTEPYSDEEERSTSSTSNEDDDDFDRNKTGAERLAEKRKMKRFRSAD